MSPPLLTFPDFRQQFILYTDASDTAIGGILGQFQDGQERVICYWSRQLQKEECKYSTIEREALAAVSAVKEFYPYLYVFSFKLITDHNPLTSLKGLKDVGGRLTRWMIFLQQFDFQVEYKPGKNHQNADALSRIPSTEQVMAVIQELNTDVDALKESQLADAQLRPIIKAPQEGKPPPSNSAPGLRRAFVHDGLPRLKFRESSSSSATTQLVIPCDMRDLVLLQLHDRAGHLGVHGTVELVKEQFYWPGYESDIENWAHECQQCQQRNPPQPLPQAPLGTIQVILGHHGPITHHL